MSRAMKDSGIPWIGVIPKEWEVVPFRSYTIERAEKNKGGKTRELLALSFALGVTLYEDKVYNMDRVKDNYEDYQLVYKNDLVLSPNDIIKGSVYVSKYNGCISPMYCVFSARNANTHNLLYLSYLLRTKEAGRRFFFIARGLIGGILDNGKYVTRRMTVSRQDLLTFKVLLPPISEQRKIVDFLNKRCGEIDEMIALQEEFIEELKAYKQSVITEAVTRGLNPNVKFKDSGIDWIGKIPQGWEVCRLKNVVKKRNQKADDTTLQYIGLEHLVGFSEEMVETENVYDKEGSNMCFPDDVIFGKLRPYLGKVKVIHEQCCCSAEFLVLQGASVPAYVRYLMLSDWFIEIVNSSTYGAKMPRANADFILNMNVCFPSNIDQQRQIADFLDKKCSDIDNLIAIKQQKIEELKDYKKSIIYEYVTGKKECIF